MLYAAIAGASSCVSEVTAAETAEAAAEACQRRAPASQPSDAVCKR